MSIRLDIIPAADGRTDRRTSGIGTTISRSACIIHMLRAIIIIISSLHSKECISSTTTEQHSEHSESMIQLTWALYAANRELAQFGPSASSATDVH